MKITKKIIATVFILLYCNISFSQVSKKHLKLILGNWQGSLTYLDYTSGKSYTMPANLEVIQNAKTDTFYFKNIYPNEPVANGIDTVIASEKEAVFNKEKVVSRKKIDGNILEIITEKDGIDGNENKKATLRHTYQISAVLYSVRKDVQFSGSSVWIKRHEYTYKRNP